MYELREELEGERAHLIEAWFRDPSSLHMAGGFGKNQARKTALPHGRYDRELPLARDRRIATTIEVANH